MAANPQGLAAALGTARTVANVVLFGGATVWAGTNSLFNVEGGHRAIVFNRLIGIKDTVSQMCILNLFCSNARMRAIMWPVFPPARSDISRRRRMLNDILNAMQVYAEGTHIMLPWFERPVIYDVRARPSVIQSQSGSKDLQMVGAAA